MREETINYLCLSVRPHGTTRIAMDIFWCNLIIDFFFLKNLSRKFKLYQNPARITCSSHGQVFTFMRISRRILLQMRNDSNKVVDKIKTHFMFNNFCSKIVSFIRKSRKIWWSQVGRRWQYGGRMHAGYVRLHPRKHTPAPLHKTHAHTSLYSPTRMHTQNYVIPVFHGNNGFVKAPHCYVIRTSTLAVLRVLY